MTRTVSGIGVEFVKRLKEEEGIFSFFEHQDGKHKLIFEDAANACHPCPAQDQVRYELTSGGWQEDDVVLAWEIEKRSLER